ncbi:MAG: diguanylate cyclase domain-containing protein [bacterium]
MGKNQIEILLVEDNPGDARLFQEALKEKANNQFEVCHVEHIHEALELLNKNKFDVIFLDLSLPDGQGLETIGRLQEHAPRIPIILLTGTSDENLAIEALRRGAQDYLVKGHVDSNLLVRSMRYAIERQRLLIEIENVRQMGSHLAYHDALTHLPNRQLFYDRLEQAIVHAKRASKLVAVLFFDLDGFKRINDSKGHSTGDLLLQSVANRLKVNLRESDTMARLGGDEFSIILSNITRVEDAAKVAQKLLKELTRPFVVGKNKFFITASAGIGLYPHDGSEHNSTQGFHYKVR